jgi:xylose isomerase
MDANRGDMQNGWDTDQFPNDITEVTEYMLIILEAGGFAGGGINFDAKIRRNSTDPADLFYAHVGGMDVFARALIIADNILQKSDYKKIRTDRYASFDSGAGKDYEAGKLSLEDLRNYAATNGEPATKSGKQEYLENLINRYI